MTEKGEMTMRSGERAKSQRTKEALQRNIARLCKVNRNTLARYIESNSLPIL